jgi:predicted PurR-regulated permease PerM
VHDDARPDDPRSLIRYTVAVVVLTGLVLWAGYLARTVLVVIYVSLLLAVGCSPVVRLLERQKLFPYGSRRLPRWLAILSLYVVILGVLGTVLTLIVPTLVEQAHALWLGLPEAFGRAQDYLIERGLLARRITMREAVETLPEEGAGDVVGTVLKTIWGVVGGLFGVVTVLVLTFYLLLGSESLTTTVLRLFPRDLRLEVAAAARRITFKVSAWLTGQLLLAAIVGSLVAVGLWAIGLPYFFVLALVAAVGEFIPYLGPFIAGTAAVAVALTVSPATALIVLGFFLLVQQLENNVLAPKIMERQVGVNPAIVIASLLIGFSLLGVLGAVLAIPTAAIIQVLLEEVLPDGREDEKDDPSTP